MSPVCPKPSCLYLCAFFAVFFLVQLHGLFPLLVFLLFVKPHVVLCRFPDSGCTKGVLNLLWWRCRC